MLCLFPVTGQLNLVTRHNQLIGVSEMNGSFFLLPVLLIIWFLHVDEMNLSIHILGRLWISSGNCE